MKSVGVGLIGLGTVGTGVVKIIRRNKEMISRRAGGSVRLVKFCDKFIKSRPDVGIRRQDVTPDYRDLLKDRQVDIVVELVGGYEPARTIILDSLKAGKHVVTANKAVLAMYWDEILTTAQKHRRLVYFEAAVGGGIPVIQGLNEGLAANRIRKIMGVLNGTTNYILTKMSEENMPFKEALAQARKAGFAEANPRFDIEGIDTAHKLAVLSSIAFGGWVKISDIPTEGISKLDLFDLQLAEREFGLGLKLIGIAKETHGRVEARVHPAFLPLSHPFLSVKNEYNAVLIEGDAADDVMFYGKGAGQMAAASAVVSDVIFVARHIAEGTAGRLPYVTYDEKRKIKILKPEDARCKYYLRFTTKDKPGVLAKISGILGRFRVSIDSVFQPTVIDEGKIGPHAHILAVTHAARTGSIIKAVRRIDRLKITKTKTVLIRIED